MIDKQMVFLSWWLLTYLRFAVAVHWENSVYLCPEFRMMWTVGQDEITFEVQVRTLGYVGLGFSRDGSRSGADLAIGWIEHGQTYFQVSILFSNIKCSNT